MDKLGVILSGLAVILIGIVGLINSQKIKELKRELEDLKKELKK